MHRYADDELVYMEIMSNRNRAGFIIPTLKTRFCHLPWLKCRWGRWWGLHPSSSRFIRTRGGSLDGTGVSQKLVFNRKIGHPNSGNCFSPTEGRSLQHPHTKNKKGRKGWVIKEHHPHPPEERKAFHECSLVQRGFDSSLQVISAISARKRR